MPLQQFLVLANERMREKEGEFLAFIEHASNVALPTVKAGLTQQFGALCLCEVPDSLLMWAHYGVSHTGFLLEFDGMHPYFHSRQSESDEFRHLRRVLYREARPSAPLVELEGPDMFLVKSSHWAYEREWRILRPVADADSVRNVNGEAIHLFACPPEAIQAVVLGARASPTLAEQVRESLRANDALAHVKLKSCAADESHFVLRIRSETR